MNQITVDFEELFQVISDMKEDGVKKAKIAIVENDALDDDDDVPCFLVLSAPDPIKAGVEIEYDYVDAVSES